MRLLLDSSAVLAWLWDEPGAPAVSSALDTGGVAITVANWAEVATKVMTKQGDWALAEIALLGRGIRVVMLDESDAVEAAKLAVGHPSLSLGDRLCLAVAVRYNVDVLTADQYWTSVTNLAEVIRPRLKPGAW